MDKILKRMQCNAESLKDYPTIFTDSWTALSVQKVEIVMTKTLHWTVISFSYNVSQFVELSSKKNKILDSIRLWHICKFDYPDTSD